MSAVVIVIDVIDNPSVSYLETSVNCLPVLSLANMPFLPPNLMPFGLLWLMFFQCITTTILATVKFRLTQYLKVHVVCNVKILCLEIMS